MINVNNLQEGMVIKNYKELCALLGENVKGGDSKKAQIKEFEQYFSYHKEGNKFVVDKIHERVLEKVDKRRDKSIYMDFTEALIIHSLSNSTEQILYFSLVELSENIGMVNNDFKYSKKDTDYLWMDWIDFNSFIRNTKAELKRIIDRCLKSMQNRRLINFSYGKIIIGKDETLRRATAEEEKVLLDIEGRAMTLMGRISYLQLEAKKLVDEFNNKVRELIIKEASIENFKSSFKGYTIIITERLINEDLKEFEKIENMIGLNELFMNKMQSTFNSRHQIGRAHV